MLKIISSQEIYFISAQAKKNNFEKINAMQHHSSKIKDRQRKQFMKNTRLQLSRKNIILTVVWIKIMNPKISVMYTQSYILETIPLDSTYYVVISIHTLNQPHIYGKDI